MPKQPNILLIQTDQQRADTVRALGNPIIQTPALDRLANEGAAFLSAYCPSPVCVASRCSLLLGQWPHRTGCHSNNPMPHDRVSLMQTLNEAGYQTHGIGKMHFSPKPRSLWGFESRDYSEEGSGVDDFREFIDANGYDHIAAPQGERSEYYYIPQPSQLPARLHQTQWVGDRTLDFLERRDPDRPFFCWSSFIKPHPPFENPVPWNRLYRLVEMPPPYMPDGYESLLTYWNRNQNRYKYRDQGFDMNLIRLTAAAYYGTISFIDYNVGRILEDLERRGILDETLILFTSDHGELLGDYGSVGKRSMLDAAFRVPLLARYPARFAAGARVETPASLVDIFPTCAAAAGLPFDRDDRDGEDLADLAGGAIPLREVTGQFSRAETGLYALVNNDFKYVYSAADRREWLFQRHIGMPDFRSADGNPAFGRQLNAMRSRLMERFRNDGYDEPLDGNRWREFPQPAMPNNPDAWQLFQDGRSVSDQFPEGYAPAVDTMKPPPVKQYHVD